jgi:hypothetical protein
MMSSSPRDITQPRDMPEVWHAFICLRYGLLMFLHIKATAHEYDYIRASRDSMGRPPDRPIT